MKLHGRMETIGGLVDGIAPDFWGVVRELEAECRASGAIYYSIEQWQRFCAAARDPRNKHLPLYGTALVLTVKRVEQMIADGKSAEEIRRVFYFLRQRDDAEQKQREAEQRADAARAASRAREQRLAELREEELIKLEARRQAREMMNNHNDDRPARRRATIEDDERPLEVR